jgi:hypothetical protein
MKIALFAIWVCFFALPAFANNQGGNNQGQNNQGNQGNHHGAPAPLIGAGIPFLAAGGSLLGWKLFKRK